MADQRAFYAEVVRIENALQGGAPFFVTSVTNHQIAGGLVAGRVCDVPNKRQAAILIAGGSHRVSTPEEIEQFHAELKAATEVYANIATEKKQQFALPPDLQNLIRMAVEKNKEKK